MKQKCLAKRCALFNFARKGEKRESWVNVDDQIYFKMDKASDKIGKILADLEAIEVPDETEGDVENSEEALKNEKLDDIAEILPEIDTKKTVVEIPDEIDADAESLAMLDWIEAEKAGKMDVELGEKVMNSSYIKDILEQGMNKKLKSILKKTSKAEPKITESMLRYILYGEKDSDARSKVSFGINKVNTVEDNFEDEEEDDEEEELRRSLEAEEHEDAEEKEKEDVDLQEKFQQSRMQLMRMQRMRMKRMRFHG